jgi:tetratricopeptide (TPR) repeat protein
MPLSAGSRLGSFEILSPLGSGGMGEVYRAHDRKLGRDVALKVLPPEFADDPMRVARFEREARLLASVNHPAVAHIYGAEEAGEVRYIVMELVPGETLTQKLATGALSIKESLAISRQIAEALEAAHERGIVHRDLKPANVKVTPDGKVKVLDLGLAKALDPKAAAELDISQSPTVVLDQTNPGVILGTAEFLSPEAARGRGTDKRTDIWAFGCILYECLSGRRAFTGETISDILVSILSKEPDWKELPEGTPPKIRELLTRCLQKDVNRRLRDIGEARITLEETLAEMSAPSGPGVAAPDAAPAAPRGRRAVLAGAAILLAAIAIGFWLARRPAPAPPPGDERSLVVLPFQDQSGTPDGRLMASGLSYMLAVRLGGVRGLRVVTPQAAVAAAAQHGDSLEAARAASANLALDGTIMRQGERVRFVYQIRDVQNGAQVHGDVVEGSSSEIFRMQDALTEKVAAALRLPTAPGAPTPAGLETASEQERYLKAIGLMQRYEDPASVDAAITALEQLSRERPNSPLVFAALGRAFLDKFNLSREPSLLERAQAAATRARSLDPEMPETHVTLGNIANRMGRPAEAIQEYERALARRPDSADAVTGMGMALLAAGRAPEAEQAFRRAVSIEPGWWSTHSHLGFFFFRQGRFEEAIAPFRKVTQLLPDNVRGWNNVGAVLLHTGQFEEAKQAFSRSIAIKENDNAYANLGTADYFLGRYDDAVRSFEKAAAMTPRKSSYWMNLGDALWWSAKGRPRAAEAYRKALELAQSELLLNPVDAEARATAGRSLARLGQESAGRAEAEKAVSIDPTNPERLYDCAIVEATAGKPAQALERLGKALEAGLTPAIPERDPDMAEVRKLPGYRDLAKPRKVA